MIEDLKYSLWASYRRKLLDKLLEKNKHNYRGVILYIGGRDRGRFKSQKIRLRDGFLQILKRNIIQIFS